VISGEGTGNLAEQAGFFYWIEEENED